MKEHLSKFPDLFARLVVIFHVIELADNAVNCQEGAKQSQVPARHAQRAIHFCDYLQEHAHRIYVLAQNPLLAAALALAHKLQDPKVPLDDWSEHGFTSRDLERKQWTGIDSRTLVNFALDKLEGCGWIRSRESGTTSNGGRPTRRYEINPAIREKRGQNEQKEGFVRNPSVKIFL